MRDNVAWQHRALQQAAAAGDVAEEAAPGAGWLPALPVPRRCLFILGTGRSGSTQLMDAVNQLQNYLVRGEQGGAFHHLWLAARQLQTAMRKSRDYTSAVMQLAADRQGGQQEGRRSGRRVRQQQQQRHEEQQQQQQQPEEQHKGEEAAGSTDEEELELRLRQRSRRMQQQQQQQQQQEAQLWPAGGRARGRLRAGVTAAAGAGARAAAGGEQQVEVGGPGQVGLNESRLDFGTVKAIYDRYAPQKKLPWFNDFNPTRLTDAARAFYATLYAYQSGRQGQGQEQEVVSGFKEIRFVSGRCFPPGSPYSDFEAFLGFLRTLCVDVKFLLNSRAVADVEANKKLAGMLRRFGHNVTADQLQADLLTSHEWYDRYAAEHPDHALRVLMEHMFSAQESPALSGRILRFLGEDPGRLQPLRFDRMPSWGARTKGSRGHDAEGEEEGEDEEDGEGER
ncbi:hypothetical protein HXX76_009860 [Chlamydomonas incerta]|uniref:Sulfotransferase n=1 Tax=Chlamydomonas incerta TaxID=51695 RepID=A0A835VVI2_CHLIN|nr:hypothetical protein HXX76_009860 [Chlamydomonas incerta]|eukprot:KAG2430887.1 hypothetical protein HXX76_009860 [Chlamydomonas incerta]